MVARLRTDRIDLRRREVGARLWTLLRDRFADVIACILMPNHLHWIGWVSSAELARRDLADLCGRVQRALRWPAGTWERVPAPVGVEGVRALRRQMRYAALNECRSGLAADPLDAVFSTHRDVVGATVDPWPDPRFLADRLRWPISDLGPTVHAYVSADPTVSLVGTPFPQIVAPASVPTHGLDGIARAAAAALREDGACIRARGHARSLFVQLARRMGWSSTSILSRACGVTGMSIRRMAMRDDDRAVCAAAMCLGDARLVRRFVVPTLTTDPPPRAKQQSALVGAPRGVLGEPPAQHIAMRRAARRAW